MNEIQFLTDNEFENLKANIDLTTEEETLLSFIRNNTMTAYGIAAEMQISEHRYKAVKNMAIMKILRFAANSFTIPATVRQKCCCDSIITLVISGVATTLTNAAIEVEKK